jgi:long-subunit fatty acid transport protein
MSSSGTFTFAALGQTISNIMSNTLSLVDDRVELDIVLPPYVRGAVRWVARSASGRELWDIELDFVYEAWSVLQSFDVRFFDAFEFTPGPDADPVPMPMSPVGLVKGFKDTYSLRLGSSIHLEKPRMTLRLGAFFETAASPNELTHLDFTASQRLGITGGLSYAVGIVDFSVGYAWIMHPDRDVGVDETGVYQIRPLSECLPPYTDPEKCHESNLGNPPGVPAGAGFFESGLHVVSLGLTLHFD